MGSNAIIPAAGSFNSRERQDLEYFSRIHAVKVLDVDVLGGTVNIGPPVNGSLTIPLLGLSAPPSSDGTNTVNYQASSWGRYIPQVGDVMLVAFTTDGLAHALGYSTVYYPSMEIADKDLRDDGGIGWGAVSEKGLKPGDWDFKSARGSNFYLGDKAILGSGVSSLTLLANDATFSSPTILQKAGNSIIRYGSAKRLAVLTDPDESYIPAPLPRNLLHAQEFVIDMRWNNFTPVGAGLAFFGMGDVIDDLTKQAKISSELAPVRRMFSSMDYTGLIDTYSEITDSNGNYNVEAILATSFKWNTPLAAWDVTNLSTSFSSTTTMSFTALTGITMDSKTTMSLKSTTKITLDSALIKLGASAASPAVKGTELMAVLNPLVAALITAATAGAAIPGNPDAGTWTTLGTALGLLTPLLGSIVSKKVLVE